MLEEQQRIVESRENYLKTVAIEEEQLVNGLAKIVVFKNRLWLSAFLRLLAEVLIYLSIKSHKIGSR